MSALEQLVTGQLFAFLMVFVRLGAAFLVLPTIGEGFVSPRVRLALALTISLVVTPVMQPAFPAAQADSAATAVLILSETVIGLFIGTLARIMFTAVDTAGSVIASQLGLTAASALNPAQGVQSNVINSVLGMAGLVLIMATDLHHMLILAIIDSYAVFAPGAPPPMGDITQMMSQVIARSFVIGLQMAAPFVVIGLLFYLGLGLLTRLVPQIQTFFVALPLQILLGVMLMAFGISAIMMFWLGQFEDQMIGLLGAR